MIVAIIVSFVILCLAFTFAACRLSAIADAQMDAEIEEILSRKEKGPYYDAG